MKTHRGDQLPEHHLPKANPACFRPLRAENAPEGSFDEETGLDYFGARYYAPWLGRWTTADPLGLQAGLNLYLYGRASPVVMVDPNGMDTTYHQPLPQRKEGEGFLSSLATRAKDVAYQTPVAQVIGLSEQLVGQGTVRQGTTYMQTPGVACTPPDSLESAPTIRAETWQERFERTNSFDIAPEDLRDDDVVGKYDLAYRLGYGVKSWATSAASSISSWASWASGEPQYVDTLQGQFRTSQPDHTEALVSLVEIGLAATPGSKLTAVEAGTERVAARAAEIHAVLDPVAQNMRTTTVLRTTTTDVVAAGVRDLTPAQRAALQPGEVAARMPGAHAEVTALEHAERAGLTPEVLAAIRDICPGCAKFIESRGGMLTGPRTAKWPKK